MRLKASKPHIFHDYYFFTNYLKTLLQTEIRSVFPAALPLVSIQQAFRGYQDFDGLMPDDVSSF